MKQLFKSSEFSKMRSLQFSELLNINGGYSGSSGGSSSKGRSGGSTGYSSSSSGGSKSKKSTWIPSNQERISIIGGQAYSSLTGFIPSTKKNDSTVELPSNPDLTDVNWNPVQISLDGVKVSLPDYIAKVTKNLNGKLTRQLAQQIAKDLQSGEVVYGKDGVMCDNYVQSLLKSCGVDYSKYFAGKADKYTVAQHIANLDKNGKYDASIVEKGYSYVVFMSGEKTLSDGTKANYSPHCAILTVAADGTCYITDNSSGNAQMNGTKGGLGITMGKSVSEVQSKFAYSNFYYQKVK